MVLVKKISSSLFQGVLERNNKNLAQVLRSERSLAYFADSKAKRGRSHSGDLSTHLTGVLNDIRLSLGGHVADATVDGGLSYFSMLKHTPVVVTFSEVKKSLSKVVTNDYSSTNIGYYSVHFPTLKMVYVYQYNWIGVNRFSLDGNNNSSIDHVFSFVKLIDLTVTTASSMLEYSTHVKKMVGDLLYLQENTHSEKSYLEQFRNFTKFKPNDTLIGALSSNIFSSKESYLNAKVDKIVAKMLIEGWLAMLAVQYPSDMEKYYFDLRGKAFREFKDTFSLRFIADGGDSTLFYEGSSSMLGVHFRFEFVKIDSLVYVIWK